MKSLNSVLISIIVPIYNTSKYLNRCIDSLIHQSLSDIEIILIDDGSTDNSLKICEEYEKRFDNIRIYSQNNSGQSVARNYGIRVAKGKYIGFVDSDDYVDSGMYESLLKVALSNNCDLCICGNEKYYNYSDIHTCNKNAEYETEIDNQKILKNYLLQKISSYPCDKIFKRELLLNNNIKFPEGYYFEDINFVLKSLYYSNKIAITEEKFYKYLQRSDSTTFTRSKKHLNDFEVQVNEMFMFIRNNCICDNLIIELRNCKFVYTNMLLKIIKSLKIEDILKEEFENLHNNLIIFGTSSAGELMHYFCEKFNINILHFSDNNKERWGQSLNNIEIIRPQNIKNIKECYIYIASIYYKEIYDQLKSYGLEDRIIDLNIF